MPSLFITGSGTDVGKTFVTAGLIRCLRAQGRRVDAVKPMVSGFDPAAPSGSDPAILLEALGRKPSADEIEKISPWRFKAPLSPDMAARAEGRIIDLQDVIGFCQNISQNSENVLLIEGVGGVMVPLDERHTTLDLIARLGLPLIFVGPSYLGAISHVLSALDVLAQRKLEVRAIVISETQGSPVGLNATLATLEKFTRAPLLALRRSAMTQANSAAFERLAELL
jgi:dethiobiotin synthetase